MIPTMLLGVGKKILPYVAIALVAIGILFYVIQSTRQAEKDKIDKVILEEQIDIRREIDDAVNSNPSVGHDATDSVRYLERR